MLKRWGRIANNEAPDEQVLRGRLLELLERIGQAQAEHEAKVLERIQLAVQTTNEKTGIPEWRAGAWYT
jgi:hypothetical protein